MKVFFIGLFIFLNLINQAQAEYRVFRLKITKKAQAPAQAEERIVESTLDPEQYPRYYPLQADEVVSYTETWRCYGRTDGEIPFCPQPQRQPSSAETKSQNTPAIPASAP